jgi:hypothetical protein
MVLILSFSLSANAQPAQVRAGARVFIAPMESGLNNFLAAEIIKKKVPIVVVMDEAQADYILSGFSAKTGEGKWYDVMFSTPKDKNEGSVQLVSVSTNSLVWAGEAGDRSLWWGELKRSGQRKVADRIVSKMKKDLFKDYKWDGGHGAEAILNESSRSAQPQVESSSTSDQSKPCYQNGRKVACP